MAAAIREKRVTNWKDFMVYLLCKRLGGTGNEIRRCRGREMSRLAFNKFDGTSAYLRDLYVECITQS